MELSPYQAFLLVPIFWMLFRIAFVKPTRSAWTWRRKGSGLQMRHKMEAETDDRIAEALQRIKKGQTEDQ